MRDLVTWGTATAFLLTALYAVTVRREMVAAGRSIGQLSRELAETRRRNDNLELAVSRLRSPGTLSERARAMGVTETGTIDSEGSLAR